MKNIYNLWVSILIIFIAFSACVQQQFETEENFNFKIIDNGKSIEITKYVGNNFEVKIPPRIQNLPVTSIGNFAFAKINDLEDINWDMFEFDDDNEWDEEVYLEMYREKLGMQIVTVTLPNSVTHIGDGAFIYNRLTSIIIPKNVSIIGDSSFQYNLITSINIPDSVIHIGEGAFANNLLVNITIPNSITIIEGGSTGVFSNNKLSSITIPNSVTHIGQYAFCFNQLENVTIPNSVTYIGNGAFWDNKLTNINIPNSVTFIGEWAFHDNQLTSVTIPEGVTSIGSWTFRKNQLTNITIPESVTLIGDDALSDNQLATVNIPNNVTHIGDRAFSDNNLTTVIIPDNIIIGSGAFRDNQITNIILGTNVKLNEDLIVFDRELDDYLRDSRVRSGTYNFSNNRWSFSFPEFSSSNSSNRLANTTWESYKDRRITISFGENSFSFTYLVWVGTLNSRDGYGERRMAGSYTINGDFVNLSGSANILSFDMSGSLIGNLLTISGFQDGFEFYRTR